MQKGMWESSGSVLERNEEHVIKSLRKHHHVCFNKMRSRTFLIFPIVSTLMKISQAFSTIVLKKKKVP